MKTMKKIVAILAVALLLCSMLPLSVMAAEATATITFDSTSKRTEFDTSHQVWVENGITVTNNKGSSTSNVANYSKPARFYKSSQLIVEYPGMTKIEFDCNSASYATALKSSISGYTVTVNSDKVIVTFSAPVDSFTISSLTGGQVRMDGLTVTYTDGAAECDHSSLTCGDECANCGEVIEHEFDNSCDDECNICYGWNDNWTDHQYDGDYDAFCNVCGWEREVNFPEADSELTIVEANTIGEGMTHDTTTKNKYYVTGVVESIVNTQYGNLYIQDEDGNKLYVYGTYSADGTARFDAMSVKPEVGMTITVYGIIGNYSKAAQMKNAWVTDMVITCNHEPEYDCSKTCMHCGLELWPEAVCVSDADYLCQEGACDFCSETVAALPHAFDSVYDADCNYGCGYTREVEERPELTEATITFDADKTQRTEYTTEIQKWENGGLTFINNKAASTTNIGDYSNPGRFYKSSEIVISFPGMTSLVIDCSNTGDAKYSTPWGDMLTAAGLTYTVEEKVYTVTFAEPVDSITLTCSAQVRANAITAAAGQQSGNEPDEPVIPDEPSDPAADSVLTIPQANELGLSKEKNTYTEDKYYVTGKIVAISNATYGNMYIVDDDNNQFMVYGAYSADGEILYDAMENKPVVGDTITVYGIIGTYNGTEAQMKNGWITEIVKGDGEPENNDPAADSVLTIKEAIELGLSKLHNVFTENKYYVTGVITEVYNTQYGNMKLTDAEGNILTIYGTYDADGTNRYDAMENAPVAGDTVTVYGIIGQYNGTSQMKNGWIIEVKKPCEHEYFDACDPICLLCGEEREVAHNVVHVAAKAATCTELGNIEYWYCDKCGAAWLNAECTQNTNLRAVVLPMAEHEFFNDCETVCINCYQEVREASHSIGYVDAKAATCTENGNIEYWYCNVCGAAWLNAECTLNTNLRAVILPATGEHTYDDEYDADCNVCGDVREVPEKPVGDVIYGDANGDGEITLIDATLLQQHLSGYEVALDEAAADANGDGEITLIDATLIQQYLSGYDVELGPDEPEVNKEFNDGELSEWPQP